MSVFRYSQKIKADPHRVILQYFELGKDRRLNVLGRIKSLPDEKVSGLLEKVLAEFGSRYHDIQNKLLANYNKVEKDIKDKAKLSLSRKLLIGAYFSKEYSIESAALFNPSIVPHPDQSGLKEGELRFILSLRATGEGHMSSIELRSGVVDGTNDIILEPLKGATELPRLVEDYVYSKEEIIAASKYFDETNVRLFDLLPIKFTRNQLQEILREKGKKFSGNPITLRSVDNILNYIDANYKFSFSENEQLSNRVIFPLSKTESVGMEDLRLVKYYNDDGEFHYYGTYTAYNGYTFKVQILETDDFINYHVKTLHGDAVQDKGMALFPRKINGKYMMISRQGGEYISIMSSNDLHIWNDYRLLETPHEPWEFIQLGNCGSPIETKDGWLLITHAVGPFRKYVISACMLDLNDPSKVIARLSEPLISPDSSEREGYVPNVVYSCGSLIHNDNLIIPYAMSDSMSGFGRISVDELLGKMK